MKRHRQGSEAKLGTRKIGRQRNGWNMASAMPLSSSLVWEKTLPKAVHFLLTKWY